MIKRKYPYIEQNLREGFILVARGRKQKGILSFELCEPFTVEEKEFYLRPKKTVVANTTSHGLYLLERKLSGIDKEFVLGTDNGLLDLLINKGINLFSYHDISNYSEKPILHLEMHSSNTPRVVLPSVFPLCFTLQGLEISSCVLEFYRKYGYV